MDFKISGQQQNLSLFPMIEMIYRLNCNTLRCILIFFGLFLGQKMYYAKKYNWNRCQSSQKSFDGFFLISVGIECDSKSTHFGCASKRIKNCGLMMKKKITTKNTRTHTSSFRYKSLSICQEYCGVCVNFVWFVSWAMVFHIHI